MRLIRELGDGLPSPLLFEFKPLPICLEMLYSDNIGESPWPATLPSLKPLNA